MNDRHKHCTPENVSWLGTLHRDTRIYKEGHGNSRKGRGGQWGRNLGTLPAGETEFVICIYNTSEALTSELKEGLEMALSLSPMSFLVKSTRSASIILSIALSISAS